MTLHFQREVDHLKGQLLHLCAVVEDSLQKAARAMERRDMKLAAEVIDGDAEIDLLEVELEEECLKILALHQPVAIDLRFVVTAMKINNDLERVGDLTANIAERAVDLGPGDGTELPIRFDEMVRVTLGMLKQSIDALVNLDAGLADEVRRTDDEVDRMHREVFHRARELLERSEVPAAVVLSLVSVSRQLERIADHATNIAEDVIYMVQGTIARHRGSA